MSHADPEKRRAYNRQWRVENRDKVRSSQRTKALRREFGGTLTTEEFRAAMASPCAYCGGSPEHLEHCTPLSRGGENAAQNVVSACLDCNYAKGTQTVLEFFGLWPSADCGAPF